MDATYKSVNNSQQGLTPNHPYGAGDPYYAESTGYITPQSAPKKRGMSNWVKIGVPLLILVIIGAVLGGVLGSRASRNSSAASNGGAGGSSNGSPGSSGKSFNLADSRFATATDSQWLEPLYPSTTNTAVLTTPTFRPASDDVVTWPEDSFKPANPSPTSTRPDRPRLMAPPYKWQFLSQIISKDPYLTGWNDTIFANATDFYNHPPVKYFLDGSSGILDNARDVKRRIKTFGYAYHMTNDTRWVDRAWTELKNAANNGSEPWGTKPDDIWNQNHFLDTAELSAAFGLAYDWFYDMWTDEQKSMIRFTLLKFGLRPGLAVYNNDPSAAPYGWWAGNITGNWNCVCNGGLIIGSLAILGDDDTGTAQAILGPAIANAKANCAFGVTSDGSWTETPNYWYFGITGLVEMSAALTSATGSDYGILDTNPDMSKTGLFHMNVNGPGSLFPWGDHGPNKYTATANSMFLFADHFNRPEYALFQRDQHDAAEPWSMFWYRPDVKGAFWNNLALDHVFENDIDQWMSMRSSWTDNDAFYIGIKAGRNDNHQTHNDLDCGDFVMDAAGTRFFGDLGSADYNSPGYFNSGDQDSDRWKYYRKMTEGQNTIAVNRQNQLVSASPTIRFDSTNETQGSSTVYEVPDGSTAYFIADMTSAYNNVQSVVRGMRFLNKRRQALLQDEINASGGIDWRFHTNATVEASGTSATLKLDGQQLKMTMINPPDGAQFNTGAAERYSTDPTPPEADQPNPGVTVISVTLPAGQYTLQILFSPQWSGMKDSDYVTPNTVPLANWSTTSHP